MSKPWADNARALLRSPRALGRLRILLTAATLAAVAWYLWKRPSLDTAGLRLDWGRLALAVACLPVLLGLRAAKWRMILRNLAPDATLRQAFRSYLGSMALALVTPARVGELSRGLYLPQQAVQGWKGAGLVLLDSWTDFLAVLIWSCLGWAALWGWGPAGLAPGLLLVAFFAPVSLWLRLGPAILSRLPSRGGFRDWAGRCLPGPRDVPGGDLFRASLLGLAAYGVEWLQFILLLQGLVPVEAQGWRLVGIVALVTLANSFQVTLAGLGVREGLAMALLARIGIAAEPAAAAAFLQSVLVLFIPALAGLPLKPVALLGGEGKPESAPIAGPGRK